MVGAAWDPVKQFKAGGHSHLMHPCSRPIIKDSVKGSLPTTMHGRAAVISDRVYVFFSGVESSSTSTTPAYTCTAITVSVRMHYIFSINPK
jgi:hypothetical protein